MTIIIQQKLYMQVLGLLMSKFRILLIVDNKPTLMYVNNEQVVSLMQKDKTATVYKFNSDAVAELQEDRLVWVDVKDVDYKD